MRGVAVSSDIIKTLLKSATGCVSWATAMCRASQHCMPPPSSFSITFNLKSLEHLPALGEIKDLAELDPELELSLAADKPAAQKAAVPAVLQAANDEFQLDQQVDGVELDQADCRAGLQVEDDAACRR